MFELNRSYFRPRRQYCIYGLATDPVTFIREWRACASNPKRDTSQLFKYLDPSIRHWIKMLRDPFYDKDPMYAMLFTKLETTEPIELLAKWSAQDDLYNILVMGWLQILRGPQEDYPSYEEQHAFILHRQWIYYLTHVVRSYQSYLKRWNLISLEQKEIIVTKSYTEERIQDILLDVIEDPYMRYLYTVYLAGYDKQDLKQITKLPYDDIEKGVQEYVHKAGNDR